MCPSSQNTQEVHIGRIEVSGKLGEKQFARFYFSGKKLGLVALACHPNDSEKPEIRELQCRTAWAKSETLSPN
jgi:hypothetical protein